VIATLTVLPSLPTEGPIRQSLATSAEAETVDHCGADLRAALDDLLFAADARSVAAVDL
jgi:hypothetical protein